MYTYPNANILFSIGSCFIPLHSTNYLTFYKMTEMMTIGQMFRVMSVQFAVYRKVCTTKLGSNVYKPCMTSPHVNNKLSNE